MSPGTKGVKGVRYPLRMGAAGLCLILALAGCLFEGGGKNEPDVTPGRCSESASDRANPVAQSGKASIRIRFTHSDGLHPLRYDSAAYRTPTGSPFSVEKLQYYVSAFRFFDMDGKTLLRSDSVFYVDARDSATWVHVIAGAVPGHIHSYGFTFGLPPEANRTDNLPNTLENLNMAWPDPMGGGYHFMKMEGRLVDSLSRPYGYYVHIGDVEADGSRQDNHFDFVEERFPIHATVPEGAFLDLGVEMNPMHWLSGETDYDLEKNAQGVMGDKAAQEELRRNGERGVFMTGKSAVGHAACP